MDKKIILTVHRPEPSFCGVVKLDRQAEALVKQLQRETGMTAKYIVSQIIIQGFDLPTPGNPLIIMMMFLLEKSMFSGFTIITLYPP